ncbi:MAG: DUF1566 domain-containing protein [Deltaproteobacteria bacterium]|nr:DUF1566 domain-containing protein [Deltaproteobacteria bacterium]
MLFSQYVNILRFYPGLGGIIRKTVRIVALACWLVFVLSFFASAGPLPDTGQTKCYDDLGNEIACPNPLERFHGQDANYTINPPTYTKLDAQGNGLIDSSSSWVMVRDNVTGLIWEVKTNDGSIHDALNTYTWYNSDPQTNAGEAGTPGEGTDTEDFIQALNDSYFGGFSDWRIPTLKELTAVVNYQQYNPSISAVYFPNTKTSNYWSATTYADNVNYAYYVMFNFGSDSFYSKSSSYHVRAVRGGP